MEDDWEGAFALTLDDIFLNRFGCVDYFYL